MSEQGTTEGQEVRSEGQVPKKKEKFDIKAFLRRYRSLGLPNAKKMRRRTRLQELQDANGLLQKMLHEWVRRVARANFIIQELIKEENFAVRGEDVLWAADSDPLENARKYLKEFTGARGALQPRQQAQPRPTTGSQNAGASSAPIAPDGQS